MTRAVTLEEAVTVAKLTGLLREHCDLADMNQLDIHQRIFELVAITACILYYRPTEMPWKRRQKFKASETECRNFFAGERRSRARRHIDLQAFC